MRRCAPRGLTLYASAGGAPALATVHAPHRTAVSIGGRATRGGFAEPPGKSPRVKSSLSGDIPQRIPGTTKVRYTNKKGRTFTFSIPVTQLTHPPVNRCGASAAGWHEIDTSFSDVGNLEDDMPTELDERLAAVGVHGGDGMTVEVDAVQLRGLQGSFVQLCKDYVLMDMNGMKTSMMYSELNNGPDYEHYDRKTRRRRHWIALRHRFEDVRELLWPTNAAAEMRDGETRAGADKTVRGPEEEEREEAAGPGPLLSVPEMMEALSWAEAASTFAVRKHRPYDTAAPVDFTPLDLSREVQIVAECVGVVGPSRWATSNTDAAVPTGGEDEGSGRAATDRFISFAALCAHHQVPLSLAFPSPSSSSTEPSDGTAAAQSWLSTLPALLRVKDAIRVMAVLQSLTSSSAEASSKSASPLLTFSQHTGAVDRPEVLAAICRLVSVALFPHAAALENVDERDLCVLMRFAVEVQEQNTCFMQSDNGSALDSHVRDRQVLQHFTQLVIARCRQLLYKTDGARASLLSGDAENIPLVDLQAFAEHHHPEVRVHTKIGEANAQGLRYARLQPPASATLAQLLSRMEDVNSGLSSSTHSLRTDLLQHMAHKAALGKARLSLEDVTRALLLLADLMRRTSEQHVRVQFDRLFAAISTSVGVGLQQSQKPTTVLGLLEGLAVCHYVPSSYKLLEMVTLRLTMRDAFTLAEQARVLVALLQIVGPHGVSQSVQQAVAMRVVTEVEKSEGMNLSADVGGVCAVLRALRFSLYPSFPSLMLLVAQSPLTGNTDGWPPADHIRYATLLASAAGALSSTVNADDEAVLSLSNMAREELRVGLDACTTAASSAVVLEGGESAYQECLTTCAALQLDVAPPLLTAWAHAPKTHAALHALCTPLLAVGTLDAMEALHLAPSAWYTAYEAYVTASLQQMLAVEERSGLLEDDAQTAERTLSLACVSPTARAAATAVLERAVERLDGLLSSGSAAASSTSAGDSGEGQPVFTFQQKSLQRQTQTAALEERLLRYCVALKREAAASGEEGARVTATS